ncbi:cytochrome C [Caulobacter endophyticus]|uniref:cytochrome C n=1 Tax=Caulobacter endophyticus TaxID=2172652 RepID=UPI00240F9F94|nr:cytochrome C [Caulobacter endophyticus]MDG2531566.1 cytochrome C [Caulobacter endophyticus]
MKLIPIMLAAGLAAGCSPQTETPAQVTGASDIEVGRYLVKVGGCNDCHTPGFVRDGGKTPEEQWLMGSPAGFHGPWGVTYAANLRLTVQNLSEEDWVAMLKTRTDGSPMPWPSTHAMSDDNKRSLYRYIRSLGPTGPAVPARLAPGEKPTTPYIDMTPVFPEPK